MRRVACVFPILLIAALTVGRAQTSAINRLDGTSIDADALTRRIEALTGAARVHGLTVTIFNDAEPVYSRAFGAASVAESKALRTDTEIYGASLSKAVFAVLVMRLVEQGVLDLDKPLQDYLKEPLWQNAGSSWHEDLRDLRSDPGGQRAQRKHSRGDRTKDHRRTGAEAVQ